MSLPHELRTGRLLLRRWRPEDREPFARLNADPRVMEHFPKVLTREESDQRVDLMDQHLAEHGFAQWAVEVPGVAPFIGFIGLSHPRFEARFTPCVEIGWRLAAEHWNQGYATEGARAAMHFGFRFLHLQEIVSFTVPANVRSRRVMEKIGMEHSPKEDFDHPYLPEGHPLRRHVLYRIRRERYDQPTFLLMLEFLRWVAERPRTYLETMEAWRSSCPRLMIWEDALLDGLIEIHRQGSRKDALVKLTGKGNLFVRSAG
jgi:ribosomal-protein-alanine N-acetyltransferase